MLSAILIPSIPEYLEKCDEIEDASMIYLDSGSYLICLPTGPIPESFRQMLVPGQIETGHKIPVHANQHYYSNLEDIYQPKITRDLIALRSKIVYAISENMSSNDLYLELITPVNEDQTERTYIYQLMYSGFTCLTTSDILDLFNQTDIESDLGPLVASTSTLSDFQAPKWYIKETLIDMIEMGDLNMSSKTLVIGPKTGDPYLFYSHPDNIPQDIIQNLSQEIRGRIQTAINLKIFPKNTPKKMIKARRLTPLGSGQWEIGYSIPKNTPFLADRLNLNFTLPSIPHLFKFLEELIFSPTWPFIQKELDIEIHSYGILIKYSTEYLPDYIRVQTGSTVQPDDNDIKIIYPNRVDIEDQNIEGKLTIKFQDLVTEEPVILISDRDESIPEQFKREWPNDFSLETRVKQDRNLK